MKNMKRLISLLTVVCMIFTLCSTVSFAADYDLVLEDVASSLVIEGSTATARKFTVKGTYEGVGAGETVIIGLFKGTENPETKVVTNVKTDATGKFSQAFVIPFGTEYNGDYLVVVNSEGANEPAYKKFTMTSAKTDATLKKVTIKNETETIVATIDEATKTITATVPYKVNLSAVELSFYSDDATSVKVGTTNIPLNAEKKAFIGAAAVTDEVGITVSLTAEDPAASVAPYTLTIDQETAVSTAELTDVMVALTNEKTGNLRGFAGVSGTNDDGDQLITVSVPGTFDLSEAYLNFGTTAVEVTHAFSPIVKYVDSTSPTAFDFNSNADHSIELMLTAEDSSVHYCYIQIITNTAEFNTVSLATVKGTVNATINHSAKTIKAVVHDACDLSALTLNFDAYGAPVSIGEDEISSGDEVDFTAPVSLTLTAGDGSTVTYTMTVTVDPRTDSELKSLKVAGKTATISGSTITVTVPSNTNVSKAQLSYTVADGATFKLNGSTVRSGAEVNVNGTKTVKVTAADGVTTSTYSLTVTVEESGTTPGGTTTQKPGDSASGDSFVVVDRPVVEPPVPEKEINFTDLGTAEWARESIMNLAKRGVISGRSDSVFDPDGLVTREEYAKILVLAFGLTADGAECDKFWDVSPTDWYYEYVAIASARGIVNGLDNGSFGVGSTITRQDMAVMTYRAAMATGKAFNYISEPIAFNDAGSIATYAQEAVTVMQRAGIINGMGGDLFAPNGTATRAQAAKIMDMATK